VFVLKDVHRDTAKERSHLSEIIITSILFGLTLNILADGLWSFISNEVYLIVASVLMSFAVTMLILRRMIDGYLKDNCQLSYETTWCFLWNIENRKPLPFSDYIPQLSFNACFSSYFRDNSEILAKGGYRLPDREMHYIKSNKLGDNQITLPENLLPLFTDTMNSTIDFFIGRDGLEQSLEFSEFTEDFEKQKLMKEMKWTDGYRGVIQISYSNPMIRPLYYEVIRESDDGQHYEHLYDDYEFEGLKKIREGLGNNARYIYYCSSFVTFTVTVDVINLLMKWGKVHDILSWADDRFTLGKRHDIEVYLSGL